MQQYYLLDLLPYKNETLILDSKTEQRLLLLVHFFLNEVIETIQGFFLKQELFRFDPHVGENACQIRAIYLLDLLQSVSKNSYSRMQYTNLCEQFFMLKQQVDRLIKDDYNLSLSSGRKETIEVYLHKLGLNPPLTSHLLYLTWCHFLTKFGGINQAENTIINYPKLFQKLNVSKNLARRIIHQAQKFVAFSSCTYLESLSHDIWPNSLILYDEDHRRVFPCFLATHLLLNQLAKLEIPVLLVVRHDNCEQTPLSSIFYIFNGETGQYECADKESFSHNTPCLVLHGVSKDPQKQKTLSFIKDYDLNTLIMMTMAVHPQVSGKKLTLYKNNPFAIFDSDKKTAELIQLEESFNRLKHQGKQLGCSYDDTRLFYLRHAFCDKLGAQLTLIKSNQFYSNYYHNDISDETVTRLNDRFNSYSYLENIIALLPGHIFWKDKNCRFLGCNNAQAEIVGLKSRHDIIGKSAYDIIAPNQSESERRAQAAAIDEVDREIIDSGKARSLEEPLVLPDGTRRIFFSQKVPLKNPQGEVTGLLGISIDVTDVKQLENKLTLEKEQTILEQNFRNAVTILAGNIAHDMRTPLASIAIILDVLKNNFTQILSDEPINKVTVKAQAEELIELMKTSVLDMNNFISSNLKSIQNLVSGHLTEEDFIVCHVFTCIDDAISQYPFQSGEKELVTIDINYTFDFLAYPVLFYRVVFDLLHNILALIKKTDQGNIVIYTTSCNKFNKIHFKSNTQDLSNRALPLLFDGHKPTEKEGTSISLPFCKLTMQSFGGDIICTSENEHTEFVLLFPKLKSNSKNE